VCFHHNENEMTGMKGTLS